jgi:hypothetical protein
MDLVNPDGSGGARRSSMLKGDLTTTPLAPLLIELAEQQSTGCLHISDAAGDEALIYFRTGLVYAVSVPGRRPQLGAKLVSSGALAPEALADALEAQRTELQGWRLGELLVHLGYVDQPVVEAFIQEQVHDAFWDLMRWTEGRWRFRKNEKTREDVAPPTEVADLLHELRARGADWEAISAVVHGPTAVPVLSTRGGGAPETTLDPDAWSMLCKIDGERSVAELARDCGYTLFEAGHVLMTLVQAGLADIEEDVEVGGVALQAVPADDDDALYGATSVSSALVADAAEAQPSADGKDEDEDEDDSFAQLARLVTEVAATVLDDAPAAVPEALSQMPLRPAGDDQSFAASIARVSEALSDALGPATHGDDPFEVPAEFQARRAASQRPAAKPERTPEMERRERLRAAAAAELAAAHALAEALRQAATEEPSEEEERVADVVDLDEVRRESEGGRAEAERVAAEEEAAHVAAEEEAARVAEEEAARVAAEEAARLEAERIAAEEEAARVAAEEEEAARLEAERIAAEEEEAARLEAERVAAAEEAARLEAEEEAARVAAEEAARLEADRIAAEEEAARIEAERVAAEEEAARLEAERIAAEEAERLADELADAEEHAWAEYWHREAQEADRIAAEEEAATRAAAEEQAARLEAERLARGLAEDAERAAAKEEERLGAERAAQEAAEEAARRESARDHMASATALLVELSTASGGIQVEEPAATVDDEIVEEEVVEEPVPVAATIGSFRAEMADTAALLRELSSLGLDEEPPSAPAPPPRTPSARPPTQVPDPRKKKRGLFGR